MNWLHTWAGVIFGGLLFAIFWTGTLSVFDREIDRWMAPVTRLEMSASSVSVDNLRASLEEAIAAKAPIWSVVFPTDREPAVRVTWRQPSAVVVSYYDAVTGQALPDPGTLGGTRFFYPFHFMLHVRFADLGIWLVGLASMAMLALCVSGVVVHRKIFADFFTFRETAKPRRFVLDLHNVTGVLAFPFHVTITLSGLIIFWSIYFPGGGQAVYANRAALNADLFDIRPLPRANKPADQMASLDDIVKETHRLWGDEPLRSVSVRNLGDAASYVQVTRSHITQVLATTDVAYFDAATGRLLYQRVPLQPVLTAQRFITGLHEIQFRHWSLRWLYFLLGLAGCAMIATGYLFWLEARRKRHAQLGLRGVGLIQGLTIGSVTGILIATLLFFVVNRLLPLGASFAGQDRAALEVWAFYLVWFAAFVHAWLRPRRAWIVQCWAIAGLSVSAVVLNWVTTGDHLARTLIHRYLWPVGGMDVVLLIGATVAALTAHRLSRRPVMQAMLSRNG